MNLTRTRRAAVPQKNVPDRLPPHEIVAEAAVLGCMLLDSESGMDQAREAGLAAGWFYDLRNAMIWQAMCELEEAGVRLEPVALCQRLAKNNGALEQAGGVAYISTLPDQTAGTWNLWHYLEIVRKAWLLRRTLAMCTEAAVGVYEPDADPALVLSRVERTVLELADGQALTEQRLKEIVLQVLAGLEDYHRGRAQIQGLTTGLEYLDKLLCGFGGKHGNYIVVSARPGLGKTSIATQIAEHLAIDYVWFDPVVETPAAGGPPQPVMELDAEGRERFKTVRKVGVPVAVFTLEMAADALVQRMIFQRARADMQRWRTGFARSEDLPPLTKAAAELAAANIYIDDTGRCTIEVLRARARRMWRQYGIKCFIIDYIQLLRTAGKRFREDRVQELSEISGEIQALGKELQVPVIVLAQMNRDYEKEPNRKPRLSDLKDCGSIEQDADQVGFLYQPKLRTADEERYQKAMQEAYGNDWSRYPWRVDLLWAKNRYGPTGVVQMLFQRSCTRFLDWNAWLKERGQLPPAQGEKAPALEAGQEEMDV